MDFARALVVFAHPDDAEFGYGGTVAKWTAEGTEVQYVCITDGSAGSNEPGVTREQMRPIRRREQKAACDVLGVADCAFLGFVDGELEVSLELRRAVTREVRRVRPDVIVASDPTRLWSRNRDYVNHPDHKAAGEAVLCAVMPDAPTRVQFPELLDEGFEPFEVPALWLGSEDADTYVDITQTLDVKLKALACHESQVRPLPYEEWVTRRAAELGSVAGVQYAEGFRTFNFSRGRAEDEESERS
ncbi:MAG: PIG-L family deacetylase [Actinomycetota bacterium]|nr:PIG-L family deacetylase [Actinomycetota bacterium]